MTEHTALPWKLVGTGTTDIVDSNGKAIACVYISDEREANARFIVTACNNHDRNVALLERLRKNLCNCGLFEATIRPGSHTPSCEYFRKAEETQ